MIYYVCKQKKKQNNKGRYFTMEKITENFYKEKNFFYILTETGKKYTFDINKQEIIGLQGKPIKKINNYLINEIMLPPALRTCFYKSSCFTYFKFFEILYNIKKEVALRITEMNFFLLHNDFKFTPKKPLVKALKEIRFDENAPAIHTVEFIQLKIKLRDIISINLLELLDRKELGIIENRIFQLPQKHYYSFIMFILRKYYKLIDVYKFMQYSRMCLLLEQIGEKMEFPKTDFVKDWCRKDLLLNSEETQNHILQKNYNKSLEFETDDYVVIVPKTQREFLDEAHQQNNCIGYAYLPRVLEQQTNIVFIRAKNDISKSLITCEIKENKITQYLTRNNNYPTNENVRCFRRIYQEYLDTLS